MTNKSLYVSLLIYVGLTIFCAAAYFFDGENCELYFQICRIITAVFRIILAAGMIIAMFRIRKLYKLKRSIKK